MESPDLLDIGTGGGEWLAAQPNRPPRTVATESWPPNVDVAGARLRPLGVTVVRDEGALDNVDQAAHEARGRLPFPARSFALVASRHASFVASEVSRVLISGGAFVTQQVGGTYDDFHEMLGLEPPTPPARRWDLDLATAQLADAGLQVVDGAEATEVARFADVGALAWYLRAIPWTVRGFSIEESRARLAELHRRTAIAGPLVARLPAFWVAARKG
jgi:hypothetical protein